jgi:hypothetical protein
VKQTSGQPISDSNRAVTQRSTAGSPAGPMPNAAASRSRSSGVSPVHSIAQVSGSRGAMHRERLTRRSGMAGDVYEGRGTQRVIR